MSEMTPEEFWAALAPTTSLPVPIYRLYYDDQGLPLFYSMQEDPGNYIEIDHETYANPPTHVRVVDGKLKVLINKSPFCSSPFSTKISLIASTTSSTFLPFIVSVIKT